MFRNSWWLKSDIPGKSGSRHQKLEPASLSQFLQTTCQSVTAIRHYCFIFRKKYKFANSSKSFMVFDSTKCLCPVKTSESYAYSEKSESYPVSVSMRSQMSHYLPAQKLVNITRVLPWPTPNPWRPKSFYYNITCWEMICNLCRIDRFLLLSL